MRKWGVVGSKDRRRPLEVESDRRPWTSASDRILPDGGTKAHRPRHQMPTAKNSNMDRHRRNKVFGCAAVLLRDLFGSLHLQQDTRWRGSSRLDLRSRRSKMFKIGRGTGSTGFTGRFTLVVTGP